MWRNAITLAFSAALTIIGLAGPASAERYIKTELPPSLDACFKQRISGIFDMNQNNNRQLFNYFLSNIDVETFGRHNFKRAWTDWGNNQDIKRLALYDYFELMTSKRSEHGGGTAGIEARLADNPAVRGNNVHHIVANIGFSDGSRASVVVFSVGCKAFGFMYGGTDLRALVDVNSIERMYKAGHRAP